MIVQYIANSYKTDNLLPVGL